MPNYIITRTIRQNYTITCDTVDQAKTNFITNGICVEDTDEVSVKQANPPPVRPAASVPTAKPAPVSSTPVSPPALVPDVVQHMQEQKHKTIGPNVMAAAQTASQE
jgi:hypothetical protein